MITEEDLKREYLTAYEAAQVINVNNSRIRQICIEGRFKGAFKVGDTWLIPRVAVENYNRAKRGPKPKNNKNIISQIINEANNLKKEGECSQ